MSEILQWWDVVLCISIIRLSIKANHYICVSIKRPVAVQVTNPFEITLCLSSQGLWKILCSEVLPDSNHREILQYNTAWYG